MKRCAQFTQLKLPTLSRSPAASPPHMRNLIFDFPEPTVMLGRNGRVRRTNPQTGFELKM